MEKRRRMFTMKTENLNEEKNDKVIGKSAEVAYPHINSKPQVHSSPNGYGNECGVWESLPDGENEIPDGIIDNNPLPSTVKTSPSPSELKQKYDSRSRKLETIDNNKEILNDHQLSDHQTSDHERIKCVVPLLHIAREGEERWNVDKDEPQEGKERGSVDKNYSKTTELYLIDLGVHETRYEELVVAISSMKESKTEFVKTYYIPDDHLGLSENVIKGVFKNKNVKVECGDDFIWDIESLQRLL